MQPAWKYVVAAPLAALSLMQAIREEILPPQAAQWRFLEVLPDWPWEWYALAFAAAVFVLAFEGAFRSISKRDAELVFGAVAT
jgi:hypothetical protein